MNKLYLLACLVMPLVVNAQLAPNYHRLPAPPKVVFIGDYFTYNWTSGFAANPNWINKGINGTDFAGQHSYDTLARFQSDAGQPSPGDRPHHDGVRSISRSSLSRVHAIHSTRLCDNSRCHSEASQSGQHQGDSWDLARDGLWVEQAHAPDQLDCRRPRRRTTSKLSTMRMPCANVSAP